jgi:hypothetical protein
MMPEVVTNFGEKIIVKRVPLRRRCMFFGGLLFVAVIGVVVPVASAVQEPASAVLQIFPESLHERTSPHLRRAINTFALAENEYFANRIDEAINRLEEFWGVYPPGDPQWQTMSSEAAALLEETGKNLGSPPCYAALRMLTDCCYRKRELLSSPVQSTSLKWTVVLVASMQGTQPRNQRELEQGKGTQVNCLLDPRIAEANHRIVRESSRLFREYVWSLSNGRLTVELDFLRVDDWQATGHVTTEGGNAAEITHDSFVELRNRIPAKLKQKSDWWWVIYPSIVPERYDDFQKTEFYTGSMRLGPDMKSPCWLIDDRWLLRKPPHLGHGDMHSLERRLYLPQWLQHEFFHHLYAAYPEFGLEKKGHDWFQRRKWPQDFLGQFEPDYFSESVEKRFFSAAVPLHVRLKYAFTNRLSVMPPKTLEGSYARTPVLNGWHEGRLTLDRSNDMQQFRWTNDAGESWLLVDDRSNGRLQCERGSPYFRESLGKFFHFELRTEPNTDRPIVQGFHFNGEYYERRP